MRPLWPPAAWSNPALGQPGLDAADEPAGAPDQASSSGPEQGPRAAAPAFAQGGLAEEELSEEDQRALESIFAIVEDRSGVDFSGYRTSTTLRRIEHRMVDRRAKALAAYVEILEKDPAEVDALFDALLILVTSFFRDPAAFELLEAEVLPGILAAKAPDAPLRIWVPGCSTGEEVYSIGMLSTEAMEAAGSPVEIEIFGTDLSPRAIRRARAAMYDAEDIAAVSDHRIERFFEPIGEGYRVVRSLRNRCIFSIHDLVSDPPLHHMDLVSCRNVLIYMEPVLQERAFRALRYALEPHGALFLGVAESPPHAQPRLFTVLEGGAPFFRPRGETPRLTDLRAFRQETSARPVRARRPDPQAQRAKPRPTVRRPSRPIPSLIVDHRLRILAVRGPDPLLRAGVDADHPHLLDLGDRRLVSAVLTAMAQALHTGHVAGCEVRGQDGQDPARVVAIPLGPDLQRGRAFVILLPGPGAREDGQGAPGPGTRAPQPR